MWTGLRHCCVWTREDQCGQGYVTAVSLPEEDQCGQGYVTAVSLPEEGQCGQGYVNAVSGPGKVSVDRVTSLLCLDQGRSGWTPVSPTVGTFVIPGSHRGGVGGKEGRQHPAPMCVQSLLLLLFFCFLFCFVLFCFVLFLCLFLFFCFVLFLCLFVCLVVFVFFWGGGGC